MKAMILAAGLGTRLRPLTNDRPKALVSLGKYTLLEFAMRRLAQVGIRDFTINVHHFGDQIIKFCQQDRFEEFSIQISDERDELLDTGGGILAASSWLHDSDPFLVYNADILSDLDLIAMRDAHLKAGAIATLAVRDRSTSRYLRFTPAGKLCGWENRRTGAIRWCGEPKEDFKALAFSGIHWISPRIFDYFPSNQSVFSIIDVYLSLCDQEWVQGFDHSSGRWEDAGKLDSLERAKRLAPQIPIYAK
ncbi:MAG: nucleotidyltransferase family protein [Bacteroidota bacterium]